MIVEERMKTYINSLDMGNTPFLQELESRALADRVPIIRRDMQSFMRMLLAVKQPKRILEVGTAVGFSTLLMCEYGPKDLKIVTIENYEKRIPVAKDNFRRAGRESQITLLEGDAGEILKTLTGTFDMITSNPPYIPTKVIEELEAEVRLHDPYEALDGKEDGLYFYRILAEKIPEYLTDGGWLVMEIGYDQSADVEKLLKETGFEQVSTQKDLAGLDRVVCGVYNRRSK